MTTDLVQILALDDWGLSPGVNEGILMLAQLGHVRSVSVLSNGEYAAYLLPELKKSGLEITFHFNITLGKSMVAERSSLTSRSGNFFGFSGFLFRFFSGKIFRADLLKEVEAQASYLRDTLSISSVCLEAHHNIHLVPGIFSQIGAPLWAAGFRKVRTVANDDHWFAFATSKFLPKGEWQPQPVFYPALRAFTNEEELKRSLSKRPAHLPFVAHPALTDDLNQVGIVDSLSDRRRQFDLLSALLPKWKN
jgi:predicted glycoside hydrolase/deacetylase ChbG (UPF0249 family)